MIKKFILVWLFLPLAVLAYTSPGQPAGFVNDYAGMLTPPERQALEEKLINFEKETTNEIAVVTIQSLEGDTIENFANELFNEWKIGKKEKDNGILILIAKDDKKIRIEVGYGLEGALTDAQSYWVIDKIMKPAFRKEKYYQGIDAAVDKIFSVVKGESLPSEKESISEKFRIKDYFLVFLLASGCLIWLASVLGRSKSWWAGGFVGGGIAVIVSFFYAFLYTGLIAFLVLIPLGLLFDFIVSRAYRRGKEHGHVPWWAGGGSGSSSGGGGFGGFGGGSSGGGGASGGW